MVHCRSGRGTEYFCRVLLAIMNILKSVFSFRAHLYFSRINKLKKYVFITQKSVPLLLSHLKLYLVEGRLLK